MFNIIVNCNPYTILGWTCVHFYKCTIQCSVKTLQYTKEYVYKLIIVFSYKSHNTCKVGLTQAPGWHSQIEYIVSTTHPDNPSTSGSRTPDGEHSATLYEDAYATWKRTGWQQLKVLEREEG